MKHLTEVDGGEMDKILKTIKDEKAAFYLHILQEYVTYQLPSAKKTEERRKKTEENKNREVRSLIKE